MTLAPLLRLARRVVGDPEASGQEAAATPDGPLPASSVERRAYEHFIVGIWTYR